MLALYEGLPKISATKIGTYRICARKYELTYVNKPERTETVENTASLFGTALHKAIEMYYREGKSPHSTFQSVFNDTLALWQDTQVDIRITQDATKLFKEGKFILDKIQWDAFKPIELELRRVLPFPSADNPICYMEFVIDMITDDKRVIDHKSKKGMKPDIDVIKQDPQFLIYYWAYTQMYNEAPDGVFWHHLRTGELYNTHIEEEYPTKLQQLAEDIETILQFTRFVRKTCDMFCKGYCSFYDLCYPQVRATNEN